MNRLPNRTTLATGLVMLGLAAGAVAQAPSLLNSIEVQRLADSVDPAAHARLRDHFTALAATYDSDARHHAAMAQGFAGNAAHPITWMIEHSRRLADLAAQEAATVREIAAYHAHLAAGEAASVPKDLSAYAGGKGAKTPTPKELHDLAMGGRSPEDLRALAEYYLGVAQAQDALAEQHAIMAQAYRNRPNREGSAPNAAIHCDHLVRLARAAGKEARMAETRYRQLADVR